VTYPLIATKLYVPKLRRGLVARPRLLERMGNGAEARLTLVSARPGSARRRSWRRGCTRRPLKAVAWRGSRWTPTKLDVTNRRSAVLRARERGLL